MIENPMISFPLLILFLPLLSFLILIFFGKRLPRQGDWVAVGSIVFTFLLAVYLFVQMLMNYNPDFSNSASISWIDLGAFKIDLGILVDNLTIVMLLIVTLVSSCTHIYLGAFTPFLHMLRDRERIIDLFEMTCGARLLYNYMWVGGLSHDLPKGFVEETLRFLDYFEPKVDEFENLLGHNKIFVERTADIGIMPAEVAINYGVTGPNLRASGIKWDLRKDDPYSVYDRLDFEVPIGLGIKGTAVENLTAC